MDSLATSGLDAESGTRLFEALSHNTTIEAFYLVERNLTSDVVVESAAEMLSRNQNLLSLTYVILVE